jgi:outer membrane protein assembly factor BamB
MTKHVQPSNRAAKQACLVGIAILSLAGLCFSQPAISLSSSGGPPTTSLRVSGSGFAPYAKIDIYFDTRDEAVATANGSGSFLKIAISVPASALPGTHWVSAVERLGHTRARAKFLVRTDWRQFHNENMERWNPYENVLNINNVGNLQEKWSYGTYSEDYVGPSVVANGVVYFGAADGNVMSAVNASTGTLLWSYTAGGYAWSVAAVANGVAYFGSLDGNVYALNARTGIKLWSYATGGSVDCSPAVANGVVYVGSDDSNVYALNASTGAKLWSYTTGGLVMSSPAVANGAVYVGSNDFNVYALNARTGAKLWSYATGNVVISSPAVANGVVYVGSVDSNVYALNASTGALLWSYMTGGSLYSSPAVANGVVYVGSNAGAPRDFGNVYALHASTGTLVWSFSPGIPGSSVSSSPAVANGVVYVNEDGGYLYALDASTGTQLWSWLNRVHASPIVADGVVYVSSANGNVFALGLMHSAQKSDVVSKRPTLEILPSRLRTQNVPAGRNSVGHGMTKR